ncbi:MAG: DNA polymerase III subunit delta [Lachnospiraceae bacterium]|nr:DNA polymerase III subunit delta [Lachnospiraceae bacterium]
MKMLQEDIQNGSFKKVYLLFGEEAYLRTQYKQKLRSVLTDPADTMNQAFFEGKNCNPREIIDLAETLPFFADRRYIGVDNSGFFKNKCDDLADYLPQMPQSTCLVFTETEVDKRSRMFKAVKNLGRAVEFKTQDERTLTRWILGHLKREQKRITQETLQLFLEKTGSDMENISRELEKLISYCLDRETITSQDVETVCAGQASNQIFDMIHAIAERRQRKALELYYDLLALKEPPLRILALTSRQFNQLLSVRSMMGLGHDRNAIAARLSMSPYIAGKYVQQARRFTSPELAQAVQSCVQTEEDIKTGRIPDLLGVELLLIQLSQG